MSSLIISTPFALGVVVNISVFYRSRTPDNEKCLHYFLVIERLNNWNSRTFQRYSKAFELSTTDLTAFRARSILCVESFTLSILTWVRLTIMTTALPHSASQTSPVSSTSILFRAHAYYGPSSTNAVGGFVHVLRTRITNWCTSRLSLVVSVVNSVVLLSWYRSLSRKSSTCLAPWFRSHQLRA